MHLAVEYLIRTGGCETMLSVPASVFLVDENDNRHVMTVTPGDDSRVAVRYYNLASTPPGTKKPACTEYSQSRESLFSVQTPEVECLYVIPFAPPVFPFPNAAMVADEPEAGRQEKKFLKYYETWVNSETHSFVRQQFLWDAFVGSQVSPEVKKPYANNTIPYDAISSDRLSWGVWCAWQKIMMLTCNGPAGELVFARYFRPLSARQKEKVLGSQPWWYN